MHLSTRVRAALLPNVGLAAARAAPNLYSENETITKFEIMDGAPVRGSWSGSARP
mgnify:CR=1 FL=1